MSKLIARLRHDFPECEHVSTFEAAIPAYSIQIILEVLQKQELTTFQSYILELLSMKACSLETIAYYLGVDQEALTSSLASLLKLQFVEQGDPHLESQERLFSLTGRGQEAIRKQGPPPVPTRKIGRFLFNALTERATLDDEDTLYPDQVDKLGLFVLSPKETGRPTLGQFTEHGVKSVLRDAPAFKDATIVGLLKLKEASPRYFAPVTVVVLQHNGTGEKTVAVYRNGIQQRPETEALQRQLEAKKFQIPSIGTPLQRQEKEIQIPTTLSPNVVENIHHVMENEQQREELTIRVEENKILKSATQDARERKELEEKLALLQQELQVKEKDIQKLRQQLSQNKVEFLRTEQHRDKLFQAVSEAKQEVIIISPWMTRAACDDQLCKLFGEAIVRGVRIRIGYSIGQDRNPGEANRNSRNVNAVKSAIKKSVKRVDSTHSTSFLNDIIKTEGTHQKILICDRKFAITGSFNWLSYTGKRDEGYRQELSVLFRHMDQINELAKIASQVLGPSNTT